MKKTVLALSMAFALPLLFAHPALDVTAKFMLPTKNLVVVYQHPVKDVKDHYISEIKVELNGKEIISQKLSVQDTQTTGEVSYKIPEAKAGDKITVGTKCNKMGTKKAELTIEGKEVPVKEAAPALPKANAVPAMPK
ncbi:TPA: hypothetical protein DCR49_00220 [Candidatus Delongbacteria bacterium]|nr:hypothetical protein [Candidatus Delongbacteria bacterium]